jgi:DNA-binding IclR family transcriptional regulator
MTQPSKTSGYRERNSTADRALDILLLFSEDRLMLSANEIADSLGVARSTTYRYLQSLVSSGFLEDAPGGFRLGHRILELSRLARHGIGLSQLALPVMRDLAENTGEILMLTRLSGRSIVCIELYEPATGRIRVAYERGQVLAPHGGACAHCILAWLPPHTVDEILGEGPYPRYTDATIVDRDALRRHLAQVRHDGYVVSVGEVDEDVLTIAAPIFDSDGQVVAGLSLSAVALRVSKKRRGDLIRQLRAAARQVSDAMSRHDL